MPKPVRIQRKRTSAWRMPPNTVYVGRPTIYGNPFRCPGNPEEAVQLFKVWWNHRGMMWGNPFFEDQMGMLMGAMFQTEPHPLRGKNLACWCPLWYNDGSRAPCHADVLLEIANEGYETPSRKEDLPGLPASETH